MKPWLRIGMALLLLSVTATGMVGCQSKPTPTLSTDEHEHEALPTLQPVNLATGEKLRVVATTSLVADAVKQVGGEYIDLQVLLPRGADPHAFAPAPRDAARIADAHVVFINGAGLETFMEKLLESAGATVPIVPVSHGIQLLEASADHEHEGEHEGEHEEHEHEAGDPHTWFTPRNVMVWVHNIEHALSALDPANAVVYEANATAYLAELEALDVWIQEQIARIPPAKRKLVTDHTVFTYFAHTYGFEQIGAIIPGYSTLAAPSAQELARLEDTIRAFNVPAIFVGKTVNPTIAQRIAQDTGVQLVFVYHGSLSEPGGPADTYLAFMRYNVSAIVEALR